MSAVRSESCSGSNPSASCLWKGVPSSSVSAYAEMCWGPAPMTPSTFRCHVSMPWWGRPYIRSALKLSNPASRIDANAVSASAAPCRRPNMRSSASSSDCTPRLIRFMPACRKAARRSIEASSGFTSAVTSAPDAMGKASTIVESRLVIWAGESMDGVPPPRKTVFTVGCASTSPHMRISRSSAER